MMNSNYIPRLRYGWFEVQDLVTQGGTGPQSFTASEGPYVYRYIAGSKTLDYKLPTDVAPLGATPHPWSHADGRTGACALQLFALGDDESSRGLMIRPSGQPVLDTPLDGVVTVFPKFWYDFDATISAVGTRWQAMYDDFGREFYTLDNIPKFFISYPSATSLKRVLVMLQPRFEYGPTPSVTSTSTGATEPIGNADIVLRVRDGGATQVVTTSPQVLRVRRGDVGRWLMRYALTPTAAVFAARNNAAWSVADFAPVNTWLSTLLGRGTGTVTPL
jgi:hypothetical protein